MPVLGNPRADGSQYLTLLRNGFLLDYTVTTDASSARRAMASAVTTVRPTASSVFAPIASTRVVAVSHSDQNFMKFSAFKGLLGNGVFRVFLNQPFMETHAFFLSHWLKTTKNRCNVFLNGFINTSNQ
ncbi:LEAF RUST 10 DISEASE-RESISTANCE LOCUS RECEPTOR-LIKE PROTEIN KINASE-like 1.2 isoform X2 [Iris pallida]|uniref:LEAF RUST 10 DISEASE-RESISTANCE LOCUS RECEPTOR-LIKE PROTEIN KINASE-like 1.2 isoform X2 n=1 Tax=Iris pallida TaxID=29817 RepID=A0AAX6F587_IRIPA|nr:LEAF RUST 10 DISEASE-RESISTANCE LOCUS RECEPTOR-LIKE PROTEIN KINASE-like 1.2 isoform X2 [Iris pallida]